MADPRFYVWRNDVWGGGSVWTVYERQNRRRASRAFKSPEAAERMCARMNADYERYCNAMWEKHDAERRR